MVNLFAGIPAIAVLGGCDPKQLIQPDSAGEVIMRRLKLVISEVLFLAAQSSARATCGLKDAICQF
ncbi:hypothetical protein NHH03_16815 [Stieleria sp. TO1_6]|uniref:hypothetical protein n=1 Tax=Stieleria tagensis TaxID=2956795 RepID=UPI00209A9ED1|nr:hypothetical protein [Stieleria tagensis]MCO8123414.1 hypothetical protein [Stieleria tagensis]